MKIEDVEGIGPTFAAKLSEAGVATTDALLDRAATAAGRDRLSEATGISAKFPLPPLARETFSDWFKEHTPLEGAGTAGEVVLNTEPVRVDWRPLSSPPSDPYKALGGGWSGEAAQLAAK